MKANLESRAQSEYLLIEKSMQGDRQAYSEIIDCFSRRVHSIAYQVVRNIDDAQDIAQEVFIKVYLSIKDYDRKCRFSHWLFRITLNLAIDHLRHQKMSRQSLQNYFRWRPGAKNITPEEALANHELRHIIRKISRGLTDAQLQVFILRDLQEISVSEISDILNCKASTVRVHLARARIYLRTKLQNHYPELFSAGENKK